MPKNYVEWGTLIGAWESIQLMLKQDLTSAGGMPWRLCRSQMVACMHPGGTFGSATAPAPRQCPPPLRATPLG